MRLIALDTETTGLKSKDGDRIIEIALVDVTRDPNGPYFHEFFSPEGRKVSEEAFRVHGLSDEFLLDKPTFASRIPAILEFIGDGPVTLIIHNAGFDIEFLRDEFLAAGLQWIECPVIDTFIEAGREFPGARASLDALLTRFGIDSSKRVKHGALIDTQLLAQLYLAWKGQQGLDFAIVAAKTSKVDFGKLGAMNPIAVIFPTGVKASPPAPSWNKHFDGVEL